ncbi:hypothetical protein SLEP1_g18218 [Rubroshorea leprosula]|uniref:Uncharacterized protein n=1 Tax=Rubroshorea leprosula TaxID=152421 RepID=A0AAV5IWU7_9ROSI|nr:hypothetical protein SLEP1_g18218 [Rubroshorea leprosula]
MSSVGREKNEDEGGNWSSHGSSSKAPPQWWRTPAVTRQNKGKSMSKETRIWV